nr:immunoglobulin light chain junction region [Macaca mulatta]MOV73504.1 immunoglobulin light chain junction region [Macaca mulatta]MOV74103.1 immunoglobulin light chain junction region [Macaca mulatta]
DYYCCSYAGTYLF